MDIKNLKDTKVVPNKRTFEDNFCLVLASTACVIFIVYTFLYSQMNLFIAIVVINAITMMMYYSDKNYAKRQEWRINNNFLLFPTIIGGWIGAIFAQQLFDHKTTKQSFRYWFHRYMAINIFAICVFRNNIHSWNNNF